MNIKVIFHFFMCFLCVFLMFFYDFFCIGSWPAISPDVIVCNNSIKDKADVAETYQAVGIQKKHIKIL